MCENGSLQNPEMPKGEFRTIPSGYADFVHERVEQNRFRFRTDPATLPRIRHANQTGKWHGLLFDGSVSRSHHVDAVQDVWVHVHIVFLAEGDVVDEGRNVCPVVELVGVEGSANRVGGAVQRVLVDHFHDLGVALALDACLELG